MWKILLLNPCKSDAETGVYQRTITVRTKQGDSFDLVLQATNKRNLRLRRHSHSVWLTPMLYEPDNGKE
jgi:hypothetical protein